MQHKVRFYFPFYFAPEQKLELDNYFSQLKALSLSSVKQHLQGSDSPLKQGQNAAWEVTQRSVDARFNAHIDQLLNGRPGNHSQAFFGLPALRLSSDARNILNGGGPGDAGSGMRISLSAAALKRLTDNNISAPYPDQTWPLIISDAWCFHFNTGIGILSLDVEYCEPGKHQKHKLDQVSAIAEMNYRLFRNADNKQTATIAWPQHSNSVNGLRALILAINPWLADNRVVHGTDAWRTIYTYTAIQTDEVSTDDELKEQAFRLARHYNDAYLPSEQSLEQGISQPFATVMHYHSIEGCSTIVRPTANQAALDNFINTAVNQAYEPITLLAYSEYLFLHNLSQGTNITVDMRNPSEQDFAQLRQYRAKLYNFRLNNRFSHVGQLTQHNDYYAALKTALGTGALLEDISTDVSEIEDFIADHIAEKNRQSLANIKLMGSMFAALVLLADLSGISILQALTDDELPLVAKIIFWSLAIGIPAIFLLLSKWLKNHLD
ncbi:MAG: hypothetical protein HWE13_06145 [Gammaproteobacteria bacterium]|nr:hypothetical protein [Gammaproteobacteria bacterium]NVK87685.1 hypothetical protein [Gammaproteobacteria bacterium]